jgi:glycerol kinase
MSIVLAIDQSTSGTKALLLNEENEVLARASRGHQQTHPQPGWVEQDGNEIWINVQIVIKEILGCGCPQPTRISITNQRETFVLFDRDGIPVAPVVGWQCRRGVPIASALAGRPEGKVVAQLSGLFVDTYFSAPKLSRLLREDSDLAEAIRQKRILFGTIDTYLIYRLTGGKVYATDATNASRTMLFSLQSGGWDSQLCDIFETPILSLPEVRSSSDEFGFASLPVAGSPVVPICGVMGDSQASLLAQHCVSEGDTKVTFGTGSSLLMTKKGGPRRPEKGIVCALAWRIGGVDTFALESIINFSAATLNWLKDQLGIFSNWDEAEKLAMSVSDTGGVELVPAFVGLGAPHWLPEARALISGMTSHTERAHIIRAGYEAVAMQIADALNCLCEASGHDAGILRADGGPTRSDFLMGLTSAFCRCPLEVNMQAELSPVGAVLAGRVGAGEITLSQLEKQPPACLRSIHESILPEAFTAKKKSWELALRRTALTSVEQ